LDEFASYQNRSLIFLSIFKTNFNFRNLLDPIKVKRLVNWWFDTTMLCGLLNVSGLLLLLMMLDYI